MTLKPFFMSFFLISSFKVCPLIYLSMHIGSQLSGYISSYVVYYFFPKLHIAHDFIYCDMFFFFPFACTIDNI